MLDVGLFYFFAGLAVISAILVVTRRNAVHSAIFLVTALLATAGIFLQLHAEFLFIVQVILYVGGIMVLFIFVIMLVNLDVSVRQMRFNRMWVVGLLLALALGARTVSIKRLNEAAIQKIDASSSSFWAAKNSADKENTGLGLMDRQRVKLWLRDAYQQLDAVDV